MKERVKLGICQWSLPFEGPYGCKVVREIGLDGIQLDVGSWEKGFPLSRKSVQQGYLEMGNTHKIAFPSIAVTELDHYSMLAMPGSSEYRVALEGITCAINAAQSMEIPVVMLPSFGESMIRTEEDFTRAVDCLQYACDYAGEKGVTVATENALSASEIYALFEAVGRKNLRLYYDSQNHYLQKGYNIADLLKEVGSLVCEVHLKDGKEGQLSAALLGEGETGFFQTMRVLQEIQYSGWLVLENYYDREPLRLQGADPLDLVKKDVAIVKETITDLS